MSVTKSVMTITSVAVALLFGGGVYLYVNMDNLAKNAIERIASDAMGTAVQIGEMEINIQERQVKARSITIANLEGYQKPHIITINEINGVLDTADETLIHIQDISVDGTDVYLEVKESGTNLGALKRSLSPAEPQPESESEQAYKVIIDQLAITNSTINPSVTLLESQDIEPVSIPAIRLTDIGKQENGIHVQDAIAQITAVFIAQASETASRKGLFKGLSADALKELGTSQINDLKNRLGGQIEDIGKSLGGLLGGE